MFVDKEIAQRRFNTCKKCENFTTAYICNQCGCYMKFKVKLKTASCPIYMWK